MKKILLFLFLLPILLFGQADQSNIPIWKSSTKETNINSVSSPKIPLFGLKDSTAGKGSITTFKTPRIKFPRLSGVNSGTVTGNVLWLKGDSLQSSPKDSITTNAANGLTKTNNTIELGGTLNQNTLVEGNYSLSTNTTALNLINKNTGFDTDGSGFDAAVQSVAIQTDQTIVVGGEFTTYNGAACPDKLVRLFANGYLDTTFNAGGSGFNANVYEVKIQADGKILVGGAFTTYNGAACTDGLVRLNTDGSLDSTFNSGGAGFNNIVYAIYIQSDGKVLVGGSFTTYNGTNCPDGLIRTSLMGVIDATFNSGGAGFSPALVNDIGIQSDGKIIIAGGFADYNGSSCNDNLARLSTTGANDATFNVSGTGFNNTSYSLLVLANDKIIVTGGWTLYNGASIPSYICRINANGSADGSFNTGGAGANQLMTCIVKQTDGKLVVGGNLTTYNGVACSNRLIRLDTNGTIDNTFNYNQTGFSNQVETVGLQTDGKLVVGGGFTQYNNRDCWDRIARLSDKGNIDVQVRVFMDATTGVLTYASNYNYLFLGDTTIPDLGFIKQLTSDSINAHGGGSIDTNQVFSAEQGRGTNNAFCYLKDDRWVMNDTNYVPKITSVNQIVGTDNLILSSPLINLNSDSDINMLSPNILIAAPTLYIQGQNLLGGIQIEQATPDDIVRLYLSSVNNSIDKFEIRLTENGGFVQDDINSRGLETAADYPVANYTDNTYPSWKNVKQAISDSTNSIYPLTVSGTSLTLSSTYRGKIVRFTSGSAITVTIPQTLSSGFNVVLIQVGTGIITVNTSGTAVVNGKTSTAGQYDAISIVENVFATPSYIGL